MNEFKESLEVKHCEVQVGYDGEKAVECGQPTYLELCNYMTPIPVCKTHINRMRTKAQRRNLLRI